MIGQRKNTAADIVVVGFALFSMFFGAGNVIFPPFLGMEAGSQWLTGFSAYFIADIGLAMMGMFALLRVGSSEKVLERADKLNRTIKILNMEINFEEHSVKQDGREVVLKPKEFELLSVLAKNKNIAISRENLLRMVWGIEYMGETRTVDVHIGQLRKKLGLADHIKTISKMGYRLEE